MMSADLLLLEVQNFAGEHGEASTAVYNSSRSRCLIVLVPGGIDNRPRDADGN